MAGTDLFGSHQWRPFAWLGLEHAFFSVEADTVIYTWVALGIIALLAIAGRICIVRYPHTVPGYSARWFLRTFLGMVNQASDRYYYRYVSFFISLFLFLLICNCLILIPTLEEPTKDLNTTLALSIVTFLFIQREAVMAHGLIPYLNEFFKTPFAVRGVYDRTTVWSVMMMGLRGLGNFIVGALLLPIELLSKCSSIISLSFRLFGNILAGSVISSLWLQFRSSSIVWQLIGLLGGLNLLITLFFGILEGCIQAFVFVMLSISLLSRALQRH